MSGQKTKHNRGAAAKRKANFLARVTLDDGEDTSDGKVPCSTADKQVICVQSAKASLRHLETSEGMIRTAIEQLRGERSRTAIANDLVVAGNVLKKVKSNLDDSLKVITPVPSLPKAIDRIDREKSRAESAGLRPTQLSSMQNGRAALRELNNENRASSSSGRRKSKRQKTSHSSFASTLDHIGEISIEDLPPVDEGKDFYLPMQVVKMFVTLANPTRKRIGSLQQLLLSSGRIPLKSRQALGKLLKKANDNGIDPSV
jgi:hypothetical protein